LAIQLQTVGKVRGDSTRVPDRPPPRYLCRSPANAMHNNTPDDRPHMEIPPYPAISLFCRIISELPADRRRTAIDFTCAALGQYPDPTSIEFSPDREIRHLYWDNELKDLYNRLVYLVEKVRLHEELIVQGAISYVQYHFARWADKDFSETNVANNRHVISQMERQLAIPVSQRQGQQTDEQINDFIGKLQELIATAEERRQDAEDTFLHLRSQFEDIFTLRFWEAVSASKIDKMAPYMEELFGRLDDEDDDGVS
jgi:hypothetical protein